MRIALGISYRGTDYQGWQTQKSGLAVQNRVEQALVRFCGVANLPVITHCAGRTDTGVHAANQVLHFDCDLQREPFSWVRGTNAFLPGDIRVKWAREMPDSFHARFSATRRRYRYVLNQGSVAPALAAGLAGWVLYPLDGDAMRGAARQWLGEHDFSVFRSSQCQAKTPIKTLYRLDIEQRGAWWIFTIEANAFLHHMVRNMLGALLHTGIGKSTAESALSLLQSRDRSLAPPTFSAAGLYLDGVLYPAEFELDALTWNSEPQPLLFTLS